MVTVMMVVMVMRVMVVVMGSCVVRFKFAHFLGVLKEKIHRIELPVPEKK